MKKTILFASFYVARLVQRQSSLQTTQGKSSEFPGEAGLTASPPFAHNNSILPSLADNRATAGRNTIVYCNRYGEILSEAVKNQVLKSAFCLGPFLKKNLSIAAATLLVLLIIRKCLVDSTHLTRALTDSSRLFQ